MLRTRLFIGFTTLSGHISCIWKSMWINLFIQELWSYGSGNLRVVQCWLTILKSFKVTKRTGPSAVVQAWDLVILKPAPPAFVFGTGKPSSNFSTLSIGVSLRLTNYSNWDNCLTWCMGVKNSQMCFQTKISPRLEIIARWGLLPISMVFRSERSLKSKMLSLARTSKVVNNTSV